MAVISRFLRPSLAKIIFVTPWLAFWALFWLKERGLNNQQLGNLLWPLALYYLAGCIFFHASKSGRSETFRTRCLSLIALGLAGLDLAVKVWVNLALSLGETVVIFPNLLHLSHMQNAAGSWLFATFGSGPPQPLKMLWADLVFLMVAPLVYKYYVQYHRRNFWPAVAYVFLVAGMLSYTVDIALHGVVIDYIGIPGIATADLKDILLIFGVAAAVVEVIENPAISVHWRGFYAEYRELQEHARGLAVFAISEVLGILKRR